MIPDSLNDIAELEGRRNPAPSLPLQGLGTHMATGRVKWSKLVEKCGCSNRLEFVCKIKDECGTDRDCAEYLSGLAGRRIPTSTFQWFRNGVENGASETFIIACKWCKKKHEILLEDHTDHVCDDEKCLEKHRKWRAKKKLDDEAYERKQDILREKYGTCSKDECNNPKGEGLRFLCEDCYEEGSVWAGV